MCGLLCGVTPAHLTTPDSPSATDRTAYLPSCYWLLPSPGRDGFFPDPDSYVALGFPGVIVCHACHQLLRNCAYQLAVNRLVVGMARPEEPCLDWFWLYSEKVLFDSHGRRMVLPQV